jgi:prepilin-type N-terminal cleavage/methylation domain-containing protein
MLIIFNMLKKKDMKGFSLIEMAIVIALFCVLFLVANSMFTSHATNRNLKEAAGALMSDIKLAKQRAMSEGVTYTITINQDDNSYSIQDGPSKSLSIFAEGISIKEIGYAGNTINLFTRGTSSGGSITLENSLGSTIRIVTSPMGRVRSEEIFKK